MLFFYNVGFKFSFSNMQNKFYLLRSFVPKNKQPVLGYSPLISMK